MMEHSDNAFILHSRPYTDSKILVDFFCQHAGLLSGVYRASQRKGQAIVVRQFTPLAVRWSGQNELKTIRSMEPLEASISLTGDKLYCGLYLNELLIRLLTKEDAQTCIYSTYVQTLKYIAVGGVEENLRLFELTLLNEIGYCPDFTVDCSGNTIVDNPDYKYLFGLDVGFTKVTDVNASTGELYSGEVIQAIYRTDFSKGATKTAAKRLCRKMINHLLGDKPLNSRVLFSRAT